MIHKIKEKLERIRKELEDLEKLKYKFIKGPMVEKRIIDLIVNIELLGKDLRVSHSIDKAKKMIEDRWIRHQLSIYGIKKIKKVDVKKLYRIWSKWYEKEENPLMKIEENNLLKAVGNIRNKVILDLGCGAGRHSIYLAKKGAFVHAIDFSKEMLKRAERKAKKNMAKIIFKQYDIMKALPYKNETFEVVLCSLVLNHFKNFKPIFKEVARVLRKRGLFMLSDIHPLISADAYEKYPLVWKLGLTTERYKHSFSDYICAAKINGLSVENCIELPKGTKKQPLLFILKLRKIKSHKFSKQS